MNNEMRTRLLVAPAAGLLAVLITLPSSSRAADAGIEFFEQHVRPVLVDNCYKCHSAVAPKIKGGLRLDLKEGWVKGGDTGPAIVPGHPEQSLLIKAVRYTDENLQMPPKDKKLSAAQISVLEEWVKMGAPDPRTGTSSNAPAIAADAAKEKHWAFQPVQRPVLPKVKDPARVQTPVDNFVLARLEAKGLVPSRPADKRTLLRRASYDLTGLPPTAAEMDAFFADDSAAAFAKVVDRLLASPRYGERWGRYWLDVARYADTKGYVFEEERRYPFAYTYRDYVIRAFNEDLPYDRFVIEQLAADSLPLGDDKRPLAALGFLTLGRRFLNNQPDIIDDRLDVMGRGLMGLTIACARCHDHKFDPIPTKDYYSLYGVFASSDEPADKPLLGTNALPKQYPDYLAERDKRTRELEKFVAGKESELREKLYAQVGDYLLAAHDAAALGDKGKQEGLVRERKLSPRIAERWNERLTAAGTNDAIFGPWLRLAAAPTNEFSEVAAMLARQLETNAPSATNFNSLVARQFTNAPASLKEASDRYNKLFATVDKQWRDASAATNAPAALKDQPAETLRQVLYAESSPFRLGTRELHRLFDTPAQQKERALKRKVDELDATHPGAPPRAMALVDKATPEEPVVFVRGNAANPGPKVPRQFLQVLSRGPQQPFQRGSGRLELAQAIASTNNPLTARVFVNRVWMHHFGSPLVRTAGDFGTRSDPPSNPELLDYLASEFMANGWSVKKLHRLIMLSRAYQQSSEDNPANEAIDGGNEYFWRMNRRRLDFEAMRDSLLVAANRLDLTVGGPSVDITTKPFSTRRTVYSFVERQNLPGIFRTFDFASPDTTTPQRFSTTVPQQALFLMNSPFVVEQAKHLLERAEITKAATDKDRVRALYRVVYQREPSADEAALAAQFVGGDARSADALPLADETWRYGFGEFDAARGRVKSFTALPHFGEGAWQGGTALPDPKLGWVMLNAEGGHVGNDLQHAAIRRWTAPAPGALSIHGVFGHAASQGDGVRGRIVSSRSGVLGEWVIHNNRATTDVERIEVQRGDMIDFVVDMKDEYSFDSFTWSPRLKYAMPLPDHAKAEWKAKEDFAGPAHKTEPLTRWEEYAQVLLLGNEFAFVD